MVSDVFVHRLGCRHPHPFLRFGLGITVSYAIASTDLLEMDFHSDCVPFIKKMSVGLLL